MNREPPLRLGFDMDGVLADFLRAFEEVEERLFGAQEHVSPEDPEVEEERQERGLVETRERHRAIWREIETTVDFWTTLKPLGDGAIPRLQALAVKHGWEVFFITQRPQTAGGTVQRQTARWLAAQGFDLPSVIVLGGARGAAVRALRLDYHVDDSPQHCLDIIADSSARPILVSAHPSETSMVNGRKLGMAVVPGIDRALDILEEFTIARANPGMLQKLAALFGR